MSRTVGSKRSDELSDVELCARVDWLRRKYKLAPTAACRKLAGKGFLQVIEHDKGMTLRVFGTPKEEPDEAWAGRFATLLRLPEDSAEVTDLVKELRAAHRQKLGHPVETMRKTYTDTMASVKKARERLAAMGKSAAKRPEHDGIRRLLSRYQWLLNFYVSADDGDGAEPSFAVYLTMFGKGVGARIHVELADGRRLVSQRLDPDCPVDSIVRAISAAPE